MASELIVILLVAGVVYWLHSTGQLEQIMGSFKNIGGGGADVDVDVGEDSGGGDTQEAYAENGDTDVDISGENSGAMINGRCFGDKTQCDRAENLLEQIR